MWVSYVSDTCCVLARNIVEGEIILTNFIYFTLCLKQNIYFAFLKKKILSTKLDYKLGLACLVAYVLIVFLDPRSG